MRAHGTLACYTFGPEPGGDHTNGCRCDPCRTAKRLYERDRRRAQHRPDSAWVPYVPAGRARRHILMLRDHGVGLKTVVARSGVSQGAIWKLMYGKKVNGRMVPSKRIRPETEAKILAVQPDHAADGARIDGAATWRLVDDLIARGFYRTWLAEQLGVTVANFYPSKGGRVTAGFARRVAALHRLCRDAAPPKKRSRHSADRTAA